MVDWNRFMADALNKLAYDSKELKKKKKKKVSEQTPSEELQDELEPIIYNENDIKNNNV